MLPTVSVTAPIMPPGLLDPARDPAITDSWQRARRRTILCVLKASGRPHDFARSSARKDTRRTRASPPSSTGT
jgi:hypothetical protein